MILAINTSSVQFSIALLLENGTLVAEYFISSGTANFRPLIPALHELLGFSKADLKDIRALTVAKGPGSFTGLRVGLSAAKGICQGLGVPIIGVSGLEAMAGQLAYLTCPICPVISSRKGEIFTALFRHSNDGTSVRVRQDTCLKMVDMPSFIEEKTVFLGNDFESQAHVIKNVLGDKALLAPAAFWHLGASSVGAIGVKRLALGEFDDLRELVPTYLRPPDIRPDTSFQTVEGKTDPRHFGPRA
jgi:tRNA threonylcarbamoyladenosine biosynthesis protein TsaB